ncbi:hypothetical protein ACTFIV_010223 [Dictyostelium citrinum]
MLFSKVNGICSLSSGNLYILSSGKLLGHKDYHHKDDNTSNTAVLAKVTTATWGNLGVISSNLSKKQTQKEFEKEEKDKQKQLKKNQYQPKIHSPNIFLIFQPYCNNNNKNTTAALKLNHQK